jgi:hypothetical protein
VRLADRLAVMTAASVERSLSPMRRSGRAEQDTQTMQQENDRYACTCVGVDMEKCPFEVQLCTYASIVTSRSVCVFVFSCHETAG